MNILKKIFSFQKVELTERAPRAAVQEPEPIGDGGAVFISDATDEEYEEYVKNDVQGWGKFKKAWEILKS